MPLELCKLLVDTHVLVAHFCDSVYKFKIITGGDLILMKME